jgi:hypothetical protein
MAIGELTAHAAMVASSLPAFETSRFPFKELLYVSGSSMMPDRLGAEAFFP